MQSVSFLAGVKRFMIYFCFCFCYVYEYRLIYFPFFLYVEQRKNNFIEHASYVKVVPSDAAVGVALYDFAPIGINTSAQV